MIALHTTISIVAIILLIIRFRIDPIIALVAGSLYLGLASGIGFAATLTAITTGFGEIMAKIGLLIGFGVLIGSLLHAVGAFRAMVEALVRLVPAKRLPYALAMALATIFPSIYVDVQVVLAAPVARSSSGLIGPRGLPLLAGALGTGIFCGYVFVVPGLAAVSIAGLLEVPLGTYLLYGIVIGPVTALLTVWLFGLLLRTGWWKADRDEEENEALLEAEEEEANGHLKPRWRPSLGVAVLPILVPLLMIAFGAFAGLAERSNAFIEFIGNPTFALFVGLLGAYAMARRSLRVGGTTAAFEKGLHTTGEILLVTGVGGSLGAVIEATGLAEVLGGLFSVNAAAPVLVSVLLAWFIAALLHLAIGSVSVAAITAAGIIAPILGSLGVAPVVIGLAIASGSLFALQVNSNFFWMFKALLGLSTSGSLKTLTVVTSIASLVSIPLVLTASLVA
ncbi:GntP family permease [Ornithinicoccus hortensis]|uniref:H+/gluconate symporter-like permease n=1 Tax=Ornithinicoccus hortensis TaxID=82346 RepID=A0A542YWI9_9MICO|nr:GntP family permease [Ornithinicoccus hortensis]TQL52469.1 H+/gluconate symporter-like permease [Ornithinicoccus hortensis]